MTKTLKMPFRNAGGSIVNFTLVGPKDGLTKAEVQVDWAGQTLSYTDPETGEINETSV